jgi:hypothetical protein
MVTGFDLHDTEDAFSTQSYQVMTVFNSFVAGEFGYSGTLHRVAAFVDPEVPNERCALQVSPEC